MSVNYDNLLQAMLEKIPSDVDKREGSIIYDALAPCAYFLAQQDFQLEHFIDLVFPDTAVGEYLDRAVDAYGVKRKEATPAVRKMISFGPVEIGSRWGIQSLVYEVTGILNAEESNAYEVTCETPGDIGNQYRGEMMPVSNGIAGIQAELSDIITAGTDQETDEALRERFYTKVRLPATSGNVHHYKQWALEVPGVGDAKVFPLDHGPGTVTVLVVDSDKQAEESLIAPVSDHMEMVRPIGAAVTVEAPQEIAVNVIADIVLDGTEKKESIEREFKNALSEFLKGLVFSEYRVSYAKIGSILLSVKGVWDYDRLQINGGTGNLVVAEKAIPVTGIVTLTEVNGRGFD